MAQFPANARILLEGYSEGEEPAVERTEMDRGVPKQRLLNTRVMAEIIVTILFESEQAISDFDTFYFDTIKRIDWFDFVHPRTGQTISVRFKKGDRGKLTPVTSGFYIATRVGVTLEYLR
jgi:hypothetical protein